MANSDAAQLFSAMAQYGYSLLEPDRMGDPNTLLAELSQSDDVRVLEGFPVVLANALERHRPAMDLPAVEQMLADEAARERFHRLTAMSLFLFGTFGLDSLKPEGVRPLTARALAGLRASMEQGRPFRVGAKDLDPGRLKRTFLNYFVRSRELEGADEKARLKEEFRREFHLSLFFAPRQRDLLQKRLRGEALTKTEREYFSRVVKKKLLALVDSDLHRLAQKALEGL